MPGARWRLRQAVSCGDHGSVRRDLRALIGRARRGSEKRDGW
jgi:hypothetical protein